MPVCFDGWVIIFPGALTGHLFPDGVDQSTGSYFIKHYDLSLCSLLLSMLLAAQGDGRLDACEMPSPCSPAVLATGQHQATGGWEIPTPAETIPSLQASE